jgi:hypothetical protein
VGSSTSHDPIGLHGLLRGQLSFRFLLNLISAPSVIMIYCHQKRMAEVRGMLQGAAPGTTSPMPGYSTPVGTPHHTAKSPAQDAGRTADYNRAHFDSVFNKQQDSGGMLHCVMCREVCSFAFILIAARSWSGVCRPMASSFR